MGFEMSQLWVAVVIDDDGDEALVMWPSSTGMRPVIAADEKALASVREVLPHLAASLGKQVRLIHFGGRRDIESIKP